MKPIFFLLFCAMPAWKAMPGWTGVNPYATIGVIPVPAGFHRVAEARGSFGAWLRAVPLL